MTNFQAVNHGWLQELKDFIAVAKQMGMCLMRSGSCVKTFYDILQNFRIQSNDRPDNESIWKHPHMV